MKAALTFCLYVTLSFFPARATFAAEISSPCESASGLASQFKNIDEIRSFVAKSDRPAIIHQLEQISQSLSRLLNEKDFPPIDDSEWASLNEHLVSDPDPVRTMNTPYISVFNGRLANLAKTLRGQNKIRWVSAKSFEKLGFNPKLLDGVKAFYLPLNGTIYLNEDQRSEKKADKAGAPLGAAASSAFYHELVHAFQYTYRLPLDLSTLSGAQESKPIPFKDRNAYLAYYYETQANYRTLQRGMDDRWKQYFARKQKRITKPDCYLCVLFDDEEMELLVNQNVDYFRAQDWASAENDAKFRALGPPELFLLDKKLTSRMSDAFQMWDIQFHSDYAQALKKAYFKSDVPLVGKNSGSGTKLSWQLNNHYYSKIGLSGSLERESGCSELIQKVASAPDSPMLEWVRIPKAALRACGAYSTDADGFDQSEWSKAFLLDFDPKSLLSIMRKDDSGTGSRPDLDISPTVLESARLYLQKDIAPLEVEEQTK